MQMRKSAEDYLEAMLMLKNERGYIRSSDVADLLHVTRPSVSAAVRKLKDNGFLTMNEESLIDLTESGMAVASNIYHRHRVLTRLFEAMGVSRDTARDDACKIEHDISEETFAALCRCVERYVPEDAVPMRAEKDT